MPKLFLSLSFVLCALAVFVLPAYAATFDITHIGNLNTTGQRYTHWWYTGTNPPLTGQANPGTNVTLTIDGKAENVTSDSLGNWTYSPTTLTPGDHSVNITSEGSYIVFTLTIGSNVPSSLQSSSPATGRSGSSRVATSSGQSLLVAGSPYSFILISSLGAIMLLGGYALKKRTFFLR